MVLTIASSQEMTDVMSAVIIVDFDASHPLLWPPAPP